MTSNKRKRYSLLPSRNRAPAEAAAGHHLSRLLSAVDEPDRQLSLALDVDHSAWFADKVVVDQVVGLLRDLDQSTRAIGFHAAGSIDGIAPQVVDELLATDHTRDHRP